MAFYLAQPNHLVLHQYAIAVPLLNIVSRIVTAGLWTQIDDVGIDRQAVLLNAASDIANHAAIHGRATIGSLKLVMDQCLFAADAHADEAIGAMGFNGGLLGVENVEHFQVVVLEGEASEVCRVGVDEMFGDGIKLGHRRCLGWFGAMGKK